MLKKWIFAGVVGLLIVFLIPHSLPFVFAFITAILFEGIVKRLMGKFKINRLSAICVIMTIYIAIVGSVTYYLITVAAEQVMIFSANIPSLASQFYDTVVLPLLKQWQEYTKDLPPSVQSAFLQMANSLPATINEVTRNLGSILFNIVADVPAFLLKLLIYIIAVFFVCMELPQIKRGFESLLSDGTRERLHLVVNQLKIATIGYLKTQTILSSMTFILVYGTLLVIDAPFKLFLACLITVFDILPVVGIGSIFVPWGVATYMIGDHRTAVILLFMFVFVTIVRRIVEPKLLSLNIGISPLAALLSLYIGFEILGFIGVFIGPGLIIIFNTLMRTKVIRFNWKY